MCETRTELVIFKHVLSLEIVRCPGLLVSRCGPTLLLDQTKYPHYSLCQL